MSGSYSAVMDVVGWIYKHTKIDPSSILHPYPLFLYFFEQDHPYIFFHFTEIFFPVFFYGFMHESRLEVLEVEDADESEIESTSR